MKDLDTSPVTKDELKGFYSFGVAGEGFSAMAVAVFFPIILKSLVADEAYVRSETHSVKCDTTGEYYCDVNFFGSWIDTTAIVLYATSLSVLLQFILFTALSSLADFGPRRKQFMIGFGVLTAICGLAMLLIRSSSQYAWALLIFILGNTFFGASWVFFYAWVPVLTRSSPEVLEADANPDVSDDEYYHISDRVGNEISSKGFFYGYVTAVAQLILAAAFVIFTAKKEASFGWMTTYPMHICIAAISIWQLVITFAYTNRLMKPRPGPPLPTGENYFTFSFKNCINFANLVYSTLRQAPKLSQLFKFLIAWFIYSDSFSTVVSSAILFAQSELGADTTILLGSAIIVPLFAGLGNILWVKIQKKFNMTTKQVLLIQCALYSLLPIYGILGFFVPKGTFFGLQNKWEVPLVGVFHGLLLGATQSSCRVMFSELLPHGHEAEFFGLYEVTDKGSSWVGPLLIGFITDKTGSVRWSFLLIAVFFLAPMYLFWSLDVQKGQREARDFIKTEDRHHVQRLSLELNKE